MAIFRKKPTASEPVWDESNDGVQRFFDHYFKELQSRGQAAFDKSIKQQTADFQDDLDSALSKSNVQLQRQLGDILNGKINANYRQLEASQTQAMKLLYRSTKALIENYQRVAGELEKHISEQDDYLKKTAAIQRGHMSQGQTAYDAALKALQDGVTYMQDQESQLQALIDQRAQKTQERITQVFVDNMAVIVEAYVRDALADQFDASQQMPGIIADLESRKQDMVDDIKL